MIDTVLATIFMAPIFIAVFVSVTVGVIMTLHSLYLTIVTGRWRN